MNLKEDIKLGFEALKLNREAVKKIISKTDNGWAVTLIIGLSAGINTLFMALLGIEGPFGEGPIGYESVIGMVIFAPIGFIIASSLIHLGAKILGGKGTGIGMYKGLGSLSLLQLISWIPIINLAAIIWNIVAEVVTISEVHQFSKWRAFFSLFIVGAIIIAIMIAIFGAAMFTTIASL